MKPLLTVVLPLLLVLRRLWPTRLLGASRVQALLSGGAPVVFAVRHEDLLSLVLAAPPYAPTVLISHSDDGALAAALAAALALPVERGSRSRGGVRAALRLLRHLPGGPVLLAVDGPRGPRGRVAEGVERLTGRARAWVVPLIVSGAAWRLGSWDQHRVPCGPIHLRFGVPRPPSSRRPLQRTFDRYDAAAARERHE